MSRRYVTLYLGDPEKEALTYCPAGTKRGHWINHLAAQMATWHADQWTTFVRDLAPRPKPRRGKLSVALPTDLATELDQLRGHVSLADALRTALLRAAGIAYAPIPSLDAPEPASGLDPTAPPPLADLDPSVREPAPTFTIDTRVNDEDIDGCSVAFEEEEATPDQVREVRTRFRKSKPRGQACYPDLTSEAQCEIATRLLDASPITTVEFWLGVRLAYDRRHAFTGLADPQTTLDVLTTLIDACARTMDVKITQYRLGSDPSQVLLHVAVLLKSLALPRFGDVEVIAGAEGTGITGAPSTGARAQSDTARLDKQAKRIAVTHSELAALRGEFHEYRDAATSTPAADKAALENLATRVDDLDERVADLEGAFETLIPLLDQFKLKWRR